jgi:chromosomal replication initiation ATPase DnaA
MSIEAAIQARAAELRGKFFPATTLRPIVKADRETWAKPFTAPSVPIFDWRKILAPYCAKLGIADLEIRREKRTAKLVSARKVIARRLRADRGMTVAQIAYVIRKDPSTVAKFLSDDPAVYLPKPAKVGVPKGTVLSPAEKIIVLACAMYGVSRKELLGSCQMQFLVLARRYAIVRLREQLGLSFEVMGKLMNRDYTSTRYLYLKATDDARGNPA